MEKLKSNADKICRVCLCEVPNMRSLFSKSEERTLSEMLKDLANISVIVENELPKHICSKCEVSLCNAYAFKRRCIETDGILNEVFSGDKSSIKLEISLEINDTNTKECPYQCAICLSKFANIKSLESHVASSHDLKEIFLEIPLSEDNADCNESEHLLTKDCLQLIKVEKLNELELTQNEFAIDSIDNHDFEPEPIEYKQEKKVTNNTNIKSFKCNCGLVFEKKTMYRNHIKSDCETYKNSNDNKKREYEITNPLKAKAVCVKCNLQFDSIKACREHQNVHRKKILSVKDTDGQYECSMCMRKFTRKSSLVTHIKRHEDKDKIKYTCITCKREFEHKGHLKNHIMSVHSRVKELSCEFCIKTFPTKESLEIHKETHKNEKRHECKFCDKTFYMLSTLTDHIRTHTGEKPFLCSICGRGFSQKTNLAQHMRRHQGLKPFKCENCDQRFVSKGELTAHERRHSGAHPFICDECGHGFTTSSSLRKHRRTHTGERPYACDLCPMRFAASGTLKNHRRTHTGEKPFSCSYCEKAFVQRQDLISHIRCHTGERPYVCVTCGQSFRKASALKSHVKMHVKEPLQLQRDVNVGMQGVNTLLGGMHCDIGNN